MRQIFSVILAAALVFGGTLLFAGYYGAVESRGAGLAKDTRVASQCPEVSDLISGDLPDIFRDVIFDTDELDESFTWNYVEQIVSYVAEGEPATEMLVCIYENRHPKVLLILELAPGLYAEPVTRSIWERKDSSDEGDFSLVCRETPASCSFNVFASE